jgi:hypothetical protein
VSDNVLDQRIVRRWSVDPRCRTDRSYPADDHPVSGSDPCEVEPRLPGDDSQFLRELFRLFLKN